MKKIIYSLAIVFSLAFINFSLVNSTYAVTDLWENTGDCRTTGNCKITYIIQIAVNASQYALGLVGAIAFAYFIYGGLKYILSPVGNNVKEAKDIIVNAVIGMIIVFLSWTAIHFLYSAFGLKWEGDTNQTTVITETNSVASTK